MTSAENLQNCKEIQLLKYFKILKSVFKEGEAIGMQRLLHRA